MRNQGKTKTVVFNPTRYEVHVTCRASKSYRPSRQSGCRDFCHLVHMTMQLLCETRHHVNLINNQSSFIILSLNRSRSNTCSLSSSRPIRYSGMSSVTSRAQVREQITVCEPRRRPADQCRSTNRTVVNYKRRAASH